MCHYLAFAKTYPVEQWSVAWASEAAAATLYAVVDALGTSIVETAKHRKFGYEIRLETHGTYAYTLGAADAVGNLGATSIDLIHKGYARCTFNNRNVDVGEGTTHHWTATYDLATIIGHATSLIDEVLDWCANANQEVAGLAEGLASDADNALDEGLILLHGLVDCIDCANVLNNGANVDGQLAAGNLTTNARIDELFLATLRVTELEGLHLDAFKLRGETSKVVYGVALIVLDANDGLANTEGTHKDADADEDLLAMLEHESVVAGEVGLTLNTVDNEGLALLSWWYREFNVGWEGCTTHANDAHILYTSDDVFGLHGNLATDGRRAVDGGFPFVALNCYDDGGLAGSIAIDEILDFLNLARDRRVDVGGDEAIGFSNELSHLD